MRGKLEPAPEPESEPVISEPATEPEPETEPVIPAPELDSGFSEVFE